MTNLDDKQNTPANEGRPAPSKASKFSELWLYPFLFVTIAGLASNLVWYFATTKRDGIIVVSGEGKSAIGLQDITALFTNHLTAIGLVVGVASVVVVFLQFHFQRQETKRNEEMREEEAKRNLSLEQVMKHTSDLIRNMAGVMETTDKSLQTTLSLQERLEIGDKSQRDSEHSLQKISKDYLDIASINDSSIRQDTEVAYNRAQFYAHNLPPTKYPPAYVVLHALNTGAVVGRSREALKDLKQAVDGLQKPYDPIFVARCHYFLGHFSIRIGDFKTAREYFRLGATMAQMKDAYTLFALNNRAQFSCTSG